MVREELRTMGEIGGFLNKRKKYWLVPAILTTALIGLIVVIGESSGLGPFIYPF